MARPISRAGRTAGRGVLRALPVSGDAFLYESADLTVLVDGGRAARRLAAAVLLERPNCRHIDVVICTHADLDHAGGLVALLDHWPGGSIGEFWLPGRWEGLARRGLVDSEALLREFVADVDALPREAVDTLLDDAWPVLDEPSPEEPLPDNDADAWSPADRSPAAPDWLSTLRERLDDSLRRDSERARLFANARRRIRYRMGATGQPWRYPSPGLAVSRRVGERLLALIDAVERVVLVARHALAHDVSIRWFDVRAFERTGRRAGGIPGRLLPMNAVEQAVPQVEPLGVLYRAALSVANRESLVFYVPGDGERLGVLFAADSNLGSGRGQRQALPPYAAMRRSWTVATAPHHGSETNARAYEHARSYNVVAWLRSDNGGSVGPTYRDQPIRLCTRCRPADASPSGVGVVLSAIARPARRRCRCR